MTIPLIGLTTYNGKNKYGYPIAALMHQYITAISEAGGVPVLIPSIPMEGGCQSLLNRLDGILFTGGSDIAFKLSDDGKHPRGKGVDTDRDTFEFTLLLNAVKSHKPFLGICRGLQVINVAMGGNLYTDIQDQFPGALKHDYDSGTQRKYLAHEVEFDGTSRLAGVLGEQKLKVNSLHHQGINKLAPMLRPVAHSADGLIEAVELPDHPFGIAVQWHPEWLTDQPVSQRLFQGFIKAANEVY
jgi:putative glutamine amidotransferase